MRNRVSERTLPTEVKTSCKTGRPINLTEWIMFLPPILPGRWSPGRVVTLLKSASNLEHKLMRQWTVAFWDVKLCSALQLVIYNVLGLKTSTEVLFSLFNGFSHCSFGWRSWRSSFTFLVIFLELALSICLIPLVACVLFKGIRIGRHAGLHGYEWFLHSLIPVKHKSIIREMKSSVQDVIELQSC